MSLSALARSINESPTLKMNETAALLREKGEPVIHLGGGEPKSKAPIDAIVTCASLLATGDVKYTPADGIPALKKAIIRYTEEHYDRVVSPENVIVSGGAKQALMVFLHAVLDPKKEVIFPAPYWVSYPEMVRLAGGVPVPVAAGDGSFQPTAGEIAEAVGPYTKAIIGGRTAGGVALSGSWAMHAGGDGLGDDGLPHVKAGAGRPCPTGFPSRHEALPSLRNSVWDTRAPKAPSRIKRRSCTDPRRP